MSPQMPLPEIAPTVVLVDASPLIHLAAIDALDLPLRFGPVVVPDAVEIETTFRQDKPFAAVIRAWLDANARAPGHNRRVDCPATEVGELLRIAEQQGYLADAGAAWAAVAAADARANPALSDQLIQGSRA